MAKAFNVSVMTPDRTVYSGKAVSLVAPSVLGYMGVLADHAPIVANLQKGNITIREESGNTVVLESAEKGFLEVLRNNATILLDR